MPAGLGILCASPRAIEASQKAGLRRVFFDFGDMIRANDTGYFPYTPALPMLYGLRESAGVRVSKFSFYSGRGSLRGWLRAVASAISGQAPPGRHESVLTPAVSACESAVTLLPD